MVSAIPEPRTGFVWPVYANATFAGLSVLIPFPLVDWVFERHFRLRIPGSIVHYRGNSVPPPVIETLNQSSEGCLGSCLTLPFKAVFILLKRLSRKILYFLTVKEASDQLSFYWHRAFLIDYMLLAGHLKDEESARVAREAMERVLAETTISPLSSLARAVVTGPRHLFRTLRRARRGEEDELVQQKKRFLAQRWAEFEGYLQELAARYYQLYEQLRSRAENDQL
jgi:hypothetical protein